jgi:hypothetical protein
LAWIRICTTTSRIPNSNTAIFIVHYLLKKLVFVPYIAQLISVADPHHHDADPDPTFHFNADPDPAFHLTADPDPTFHFDADPDTAFYFHADPDQIFHVYADPDPQHYM